MSLHLTVKCAGHRHGDQCRGSSSSSLARSATYDSRTAAQDLPAIAQRLLAAGWRELPDGGDLCPSLGHDEDPPDLVLIDPDPRARNVPGIGRVIEPPITGPPADPGAVGVESIRRADYPDAIPADRY